MPSSIKDRERIKKWKAANPHKQTEYARLHREKQGVEATNEYQRAYYAKRSAENPEYASERAAKNTGRYGKKEWMARVWNSTHRNVKGLPDYDSRPASCDSCGGSDDRIVMDHCHEKMVFRGWICNACNVAAGMLKDSPERLEKLAAYLRLSAK